MDIPAKEVKNRSRQFAGNLLTQAERNEPQITADLQQIASDAAAEIVGLNNKFKTIQLPHLSIFCTRIFRKTGDV